LVDQAAWANLLPILILVVFAYLLIIRPARKRTQAAMRLQSSLQVGQRVMLTSGIYAQIVSLEEHVATVEVAPGVQLKVHRNAVAEVQQQDDVAPTPPQQEGES
jgi:preprotein translocase subunit YajC